MQDASRITRACAAQLPVRARWKKKERERKRKKEIESRGAVFHTTITRHAAIAIRGSNVYLALSGSAAKLPSLDRFRVPASNAEANGGEKRRRESRAVSQPLRGKKPTATKGANAMELARNVWKRSFLVYKSSVKSSLRASSSDASNIAETPPVISVSELQSKIKDTKVCNALGATDELSSYIGLAREFANDSKEEHPYIDKLKRVQMILFDLHHTILKSIPGQLKPFENRHTKDLEEWITEYSKQLPPPEDYIIPGGGKACASLHVAKSICKRAEHCIEPLVSNGTVDKEAQNYLKRLSDFLLTTSRIAAKCDKRTENIYIPRAEVTKEKKST